MSCSAKRARANSKGDTIINMCPKTPYKKKTYKSYRKKDFYGGQMFPMRSYGRTYTEPSAETLQHYGEQWATATDQQRLNRQNNKYFGRGLYSGRGGFFGDLGKWAGRGIGSLFGKRGKEIGGRIGYSAGELGGTFVPGGSALSKLSGRGTYTTNSLIQGLGDSRPSMSVSGGGDNQDMIITHKEYLQDVYGPADSKFQNSGFSINPAIADNFPWLAQIAANYEEYEFEQLIFEFHSTVDASATNNNSGATGTIIMATNYNPDAPDFVSKEVMMQYHGANSGRVTDDMAHGVECEPTKNAGSAIRFTRSNVPQGNQSLKDFDLGKFQWAVVNIPDGFVNQQIGELWVHYSVKVSKPRLYSGVYRALPSQTFTE